MSLYQLLKHLPGKHDQKTHGRIKNSGMSYDEVADIIYKDLRSEVNESNALLNATAATLAREWNVSPESLEAYKQSSATRRNAEYPADYTHEQHKVDTLWGLLHQWAGNGGGIETSALLAHICDKRGLTYGKDYKLPNTSPFNNQEGQLKYIKDRPPLDAMFSSLGELMYNKTQDYFRSRGITHVKLYRSQSHAETVDNSVPRPGKSYAFRPAGIRDMQGRELITYIMPVERIFSLPHTGLGTMHESEAVVMP